MKTLVVSINEKNMIQLQQSLIVNQQQEKSQYYIIVCNNIPLEMTKYGSSLYEGLNFL